MRINSRALSTFDVVAWDVIGRRFSEHTAPHSPCMAEIVASVQASGAQDRLAGFTSMHDLAVTSVPIPADGPIEVVWVRPQPYGATERRDVLIEHWSATGHDDKIVRPSGDAVALFWRYMIEKFGVEPVHRSH